MVTYTKKISVRQVVELDAARTRVVTRQRSVELLDSVNELWYVAFDG